MRRLFIACVGLLGAAGTELRADEGRIPVYQPVTITQPGHYIMTRDISVASGDVISILASNVTLDLNDHAIFNASTSGRLILIGDGSTDVTIRHGRLSGGDRGIHYLGATRTRVVIEGVEVSNPGTFGIAISPAEYVEVRSCHIVGGGSSNLTGISIVGVVAPFGGRFLSNTIATNGGSGMYLSGLLAGEVRGNLVSSVTKMNYSAIVITGPSNTPEGANLIEGNTIVLGGMGVGGLDITDWSVANVVRNNTIVGNGGPGISITSPGNRIAENVLRENFGGIQVVGSRNIIEGNQIEGNTGCAISFYNQASQNASRNNMLRGNIGGAICNVGTNGTNTDEGGNIL